MTNVLQPWATIGLQCLVNIHPANFKSSAISQDEYYKLVHTLCVQKFGPNLWESILSPAMGVDTENMNADIGADNLSPKDGKTLQQLIEIYSQDEEYFERAQQLLETTWRLYPCSDLRQSFKPSAFQSILNTLVRRKRSKLQKKTNEIVNSSEDLNYALQMLDEKMMSDKVWWPDEDTFVCLFRLTDNGPQADQVLAQLELCRAIMREYPLTRAKAAKYALNSWALSAEQGHPGAAERALEILRAMQVESKPLIYFSEPEKVAHLYDPENAPDRIIYTLVLKTCAKSNSKKKSDIALFVHECAKKENISFTASMYTSLLRCILDCEDEERRFALTEEIYNEALAAGRLNSNVLFQLRWANPELYQRHLVEHSVNEDNDQESESDIEHETLSVDGHYK